MNITSKNRDQLSKIRSKAKSAKSGTLCDKAVTSNKNSLPKLKFINPEGKYLNKSDWELVQSLMVFLKKSELEVVNSIELFSNTNKTARAIFYYLSQIKEEKQIDVMVSLEYLLYFGETVKDIAKKITS